MESFRQRLNTLLAEYQHTCRQVEEEASNLQQAEQHIQHVQKAQKIVQEVAETVQKAAHGRISSVVTRCLKTVFGEDSYNFEIIFEQKRGKTEARLVFLTETGEEIDPTEASGGGVVEVASLALRLSCLMLSQPKKRRVVLFDEPFKFLNGKEYQSVVGELLLTLARELHMQFVVVTDDDWLKVGKVVELE